MRKLVGEHWEQGIGNKREVLENHISFSLDQINWFKRLNKLTQCFEITETDMKSEFKLKLKLNKVILSLYNKANVNSVSVGG